MVQVAALLLVAHVSEGGHPRQTVIGLVHEGAGCEKKSSLLGGQIMPLVVKVVLKYFQRLAQVTRLAELLQLRFIHTQSGQLLMELVLSSGLVVLIEGETFLGQVSLHKQSLKLLEKCGVYINCGSFPLTVHLASEVVHLSVVYGQGYSLL